MLCHPLVCGCADHCACLLVHSVCILYNYCAKHACHSQHCISSVLLYPHVFRRTDLGVHMRMSSALYHMQCHMSYPVYGLIGLQPSHTVCVYAIVTCPLQLPSYTFWHAAYMGSHANRLPTSL